MAQSETPTTSVSLLARLADLKNDDAWRTFLKRYQPQIEAWCARRLPRAEAEEVAATVLCKLVQKLPVFAYDSGRGRFRAWLRALVENEVASHWRRPGRLPRSPNADALLRDWPDPASLDALADDLDDRIHADLEKAEQVAALVRARVKPHNWEAFWRVVVEGQPTAEVARQLGLTVYAACQARLRIVRLLREEMARAFPLNDRGHADDPAPG
jgi:RNA polymerase sigma-70 factor (ECF subfamily)